MKEMKVFIRVEDCDGCGVYRSKSSGDFHKAIAKNNLPDIYSSVERHPVPESDKKLRSNAPHLFGNFNLFVSDYVFAFADENQIVKWFHRIEYYLLLEENGFKINLYKGEGYLGDCQAVFDKETSILENSYLPTVYFDLFLKDKFPP